MSIYSVPEDENEERWRMVSILSYLVVLLGLGLPLWWATTRVYRAPLPLEDMLELRPAPLPPLEVWLQAATEERARAIVGEMKSVLGSSITITPSPNPPTPAPGTLLLLESPSFPNITLSRQRVVHFPPSESGARLARVLGAWPGVGGATALVGGDSDSDAVDTGREQSRAFPAARAYDVLVTVIENDGKRIGWDVQEAIEAYLSPYLSALSPVAAFTVKSQALHHVSLGVRARALGPHGALAEALLPLAVAPLESRLAAHAAPAPAAHLLLYSPPCDAPPLYIYTRKGVRSSGPTPAFISPRWGGIQIVNPECGVPDWTPDIPVVMATMITQLARLLGVPAVPPGAEVADPTAMPADWQLDWMVRARTKEYLDAAKLTLRSLAQLLSEISNIVIGDEVARSVHQAVAAVGATQRYLEDGNAAAAYRKAQEAAQAAEDAFTDPSLLALLYFPDDQKYAVYIPLFLPIMIPVIMSMRQLIQYLNKNKLTE